MMVLFFVECCVKEKMLQNSFSGGLAHLIVRAFAFMFSLSFHEYAHAAVAYLFGDDTAKEEGRMTLNPLVHIDVLGFACLMLLGFGWATPVPFWPGNFKRPKLYSFLTKIAGPLANLVFALFCFYLLQYLPFAAMSAPVATTFMQLIVALVHVNVMLFTFNLLPIPPLDGGYILEIFIGEKYPEVIEWLTRYGIFVILVLFSVPYFLTMYAHFMQLVMMYLSYLVI
jgi:Zn-dependent protease